MRYRARADTSGRTGCTRSTCRRKNVRRVSPTSTGTSTTISICSKIARASTGMNAPASFDVAIGVSSGEMSVLTALIAIESATDPPERNVNTFADTPLGVAPSRITPTASCGWCRNATMAAR